jgi:hypothetical protein
MRLNREAECSPVSRAASDISRSAVMGAEQSERKYGGAERICSHQQIARFGAI